MHTYFGKLGTVAIAFAAIAFAVLAVSEAALAEPPRSPYGGVWKPTYAGSRERQRRASDYRARSFRYEAPVQSRRSFSYQPVPDASFKADGRVMIAREGVKLMRSRDVIATLKKGQEITILKVQGQWLGTSVKVDGQVKSGWVAARNVVGIEKTPAPAPKSGDDSAKPQQQPTTP